MGVEIRRDGHGGAAAGGPMTGRTTDAAHRHMLGVIELHAKADQPGRKRLHRAGLRIRVADRTDWTLGVCKLLRMTTRAWQVL